MEVIVILLPIALVLGGLFIFAFIWSAKQGQYDDLETPRFRMLLDEKNISIQNSTVRKENK
jgi:cbb3-type cytochrome oxidase maturation protein